MRPLPPTGISDEITRRTQQNLSQLTARSRPVGWILAFLVMAIFHAMYFPPLRSYMPVPPSQEALWGVFLVTSDMLLLALLSAGLILKYSPKTRQKVPAMKIVPATFPTKWNDGPRPGLTIGYTPDRREVFISDKDLSRNVMIMGSSGSGKTSLLNALAAQQMNRGGGMLFIDGKRDVENMAQFLKMAEAVNRLDDVRVLDPLNPEVSHNYNPLLASEVSQEAGAIATKLHRLLPSVPESSPAKFYHDHAYSALLEMVRLFDRLGHASSFLDYRAVFEYPNETFAILKDMITKQEDLDHLVELKQFVNRFKRNAQDIYSGITTQLGALTDRNTSKFITSTSNDINLFNAIRRNQLIYVGLPRLQEQKIAEQLGRVLLTDLQTTIGIAYDKRTPPMVPFLILMDELGSYVFKDFAVVFEQARKAGFICVGVIQAIPQLQDRMKELGPDFLSRIMGNCHTKICLQVEDQVTAEHMSEYFGKEVQLWANFGRSSGRTDTGQYLSTQRLLNPKRGISQSESVSYSERFEAKVQTQTFIHDLSVGKAILRFDGEPTMISTVWAEPELTPDFDPRKLVPKLPTRNTKPLDLWTTVQHKMMGDAKRELRQEQQQALPRQPAQTAQAAPASQAPVPPTTPPPAAPPAQPPSGAPQVAPRRPGRPRTAPQKRTTPLPQPNMDTEEPAAAGARPATQETPAPAPLSDPWHDQNLVGGLPPTNTGSIDDTNQALM